MSRSAAGWDTPTTSPGRSHSCVSAELTGYSKSFTPTAIVLDNLTLLGLRGIDLGQSLPTETGHDWLRANSWESAND